MADPPAEPSQEASQSGVDSTSAELAAIASLAADAIIAVDGEQRISAFNHGAELIFGYSATEVIGRQLSLLLPERFREAHRAHIGDFARSNQATRRMGERLEIVGRRKSGEEFPAEASITKLRTEQGWRFLAILRDRSEERKRERQLEHAQVLARLGSWEWEVATDRVRWSDQLYRIYGLEPGSLALDVETFLEQVHPEDRENTRQRTERAIRTGEPFDFEERIVRPDGSVRLLRSVGEVVVDEEGRPLRLIGICQDITEQREIEERALRLAGAEAARQEAERIGRRLESLRKVTAALSQARTVAEVTDVVLEQGLTVLEADRGALGIVSDDGEEVEVVGIRGYPQPVVDRFRRVPLAADIPPLDAIRRGEPVWLRSPEEYRRHYPAAFTEFYELTGTQALAALPLRVGEEPIGGLMAGFSSAGALGMVDEAFTTLLAQETAVALERALAYEREREARQEAERLARAREETLAAVAHDLRNPLQAIEARLALLLEADLDPERRAKSLEAVWRAASQMDRLIRDLLDAARIETGAFSVQPARVSVEPLIQDAVEPFQAEAKRKEIDLSLSFQGDAPPVRADPERFVQVLNNLLSNALKFCSPGTEVTLEVRPTEEEVLFVVRDTGPGIPPEDRERVFERYWQGQRSAGQSVGLGLTIARAIVEAHGGRIWIDSEVGRGTTIWFTVPVADPRARPDRRAASSRSAG